MELSYEEIVIMSEGAYIVKYDVGNPNVSLKTSNGSLDIRSGGQQVVSELPVPRSILESIPGVTIVDIPSTDSAETKKVPHPRSDKWALQAKTSKRKRKR